MGLHAERRGSGPPIVLLHGFTQTGRCWGPVADDLARDHEVVALDAPGHGGSDDVRVDLPGAARLAVEAAGAATPAVWLGYSMGARLALHVALAAPEAVAGLVLVGGTPGIEDEAERAARRAHDTAQAAELREHGVDAFLRRWLALPLFSGLPDWAHFVEERRRNTADGLASSLELAGTGAQANLWPRVPELAAHGFPTLAVTGAEDAKFTAVAARMETLGARSVAEQRIAHPKRPSGGVIARTIPGAGHAAHLERPAAFLSLLRGWLHTVGR